MQSKAKTVDAYLKELSAERHAEISAVRKVILKNLPKGYQEIMQYGMISYVVPLKTYPAGYLEDKKTPLPYVCLASQKNYMAVYLFNVYGHPEAESWFQKAYKATGKKLDMGKSCVRFKRLDDLPLDVIGQAVKRTPVKELISWYVNERADFKAKKRA